MRGLAAYARTRNHKAAGAAARKAAEVFLTRGLFRRRSDGSPIEPSFLKLHFPLYWHYDILGGLVAMAEMEMLGDERCEAALELLELKRLADGGWASEAKFFATSKEPRSGTAAVDWGGTSSKRMNPWVTAQAVTVLVKAGRLSP